MALKLALTPRATRDTAAIRDYLIERSPQGAENVRQAFDAALTTICEFPRIGRDRPELEARSYGVARYPYTIY